MSLSAAVVAAAIIGSVAAAPTAKKPPAKPVRKTSKTPAISKFRERQLDMLKVSAPGDEYFGRLKLSYLGINNTFRDDLIRAGGYTTDSHLVGNVDLADDALTQWSRKYPKDPQLARSYFLAFEMYRKVWTQPGQDKAWQYMHVIPERWPSSYFGKLLIKDLRTGFTEHYFADALPCAVTPEPSATPGGKRNAPTPTPSPTPTPTPSPSPSPAATPAPGQPSVVILPVPCVTPVPSPSPSPLPSMIPTASPSGSPAPHPTGSLVPAPSPSGSPAPQPGTTSSPSVAPSPSATRTPYS